MIRSLVVPALLTALFIAFTCSSSHAIEIVVTYDEPRSQTPDFDPDASRLQSLVDAAVGIYEDIIEDDFTLNLAFTWGDLGSDGTLGVATTLETDNGRPTSSRMRFNTNESVDWFLDPTPTEHSEYSLVQTTVADLSAAIRAEAYSGSPPDELEVGFAGVRNSAFGSIDLLSVVIHELGHAVGLGSLSFGTTTNDGDFDVPTQFLNGASAGIRISTEEDRAHLAAPRTAMFPQIVSDIRRLPSATDILAIASSAGWQDIDLPRKEFVGDGSWHDPQRWIGNREPDSDDEVTARSGGQILIDQLANANTVRITDGSQLVVEGGLQANELSLGDASHRVVVNSDFAGIDIANTASLDGTLFVELTTNVSVGDSFELFSAPNLVGDFERIDVSLPSNNRGLVVDQRPNSIVATVAQVGDTNTDGIVDFRDFLTLSRNFGNEGSWRDGNFDNDLTVGFEDFLGLSGNFGSQAASGGSSEPLTSSVPEPSSSILALASLTLLAFRSHRRPHRKRNGR